ncbi:hypothetical protein ABEF92_000998 [Exophiala dermatitidis]|uniref:Uncharacterized protein n=2 Tax=Exophiala dermatitidis TaxID=5970 RepID=H6BTS5_EXODN|nr:uncharacterized protein HMPREF1120_03636 [Exophiala dermatitidis NIH/UT8656]EHY55502.1 hypothetical protein HMPREF1120_03636 [Exophiala dermatitidis NIH/UT8656]
MLVEQYTRTSHTSSLTTAVTMKPEKLLLLAPIGGLMVTAQPDAPDPLEVFASEAFSVYTEATSILASAASVASAVIASDLSAIDASSTSSQIQPTSAADVSISRSSASSKTASITSSAARSSLLLTATSEVSLLLHSPSSSAISSSSLTSQTTSASPSPSSLLGTSSVLGAAAESSAAAAASKSGSGNHGHKLAIILGCVLGALALGMTILTVLICHKRRPHGQSPRHRALSPGDDEVEGWRLNRPSTLLSQESMDTLRRGSGLQGAAPLMSEHPAFRNSGEHENPFVPIIPPPRRTAPNSRPGLTDGVVPGDDPFVMKKETAVSGSSKNRSVHNTAYAPKPKTDSLAARLAAAAAKEDLLQQQRHSDSDTDSVANEKYTVQAEPQTKINRKPVPVSHVNNGERWPYSSVSPVSPISPTDFSAETTLPPVWGSSEHHRSFSRDAARANAVFDHEYSPLTGQHDNEGESSDDATAAAAAAPPTQDDHQGCSRNSSLSSASNYSSDDSTVRAPSPLQPSLFSTRATAEQSTPPERQSSIFIPSNPFITPTGSPEPGDVPTTDVAPVIAPQAPPAAAVAVAAATQPSAPAQAPAPQPQPQHQTAKHQTYPKPAPLPPARSSRRTSTQTAPYTSVGSGAASFAQINRPAVPSPLSSELRRDDSGASASVRPGRASVADSKSLMTTIQKAKGDKPRGYRNSYHATPTSDWDSYSRYQPYPVDLANVPNSPDQGSGGDHDFYVPELDDPISATFTPKGRRRRSSPTSAGAGIVGDSRYPNLSPAMPPPSRDWEKGSTGGSHDMPQSRRFSSGWHEGQNRTKMSDYGRRRSTSTADRNHEQFQPLHFGGNGNANTGRRRLRPSMDFTSIREEQFDDDNNSRTTMYPSGRQGMDVGQAL